MTGWTYWPRGTSLRAAAAVGALAAVVLGVAGCGGNRAPKAAAPASTTLTSAAGGTSYYLALGDSLAAGVQPAPADTSAGPKRIKAGATATQGYVNDIYAIEKTRIRGLELQDLGCPGETAITMMRGGECRYAMGSQLAQAVQFIHGHKIAFISLDIGADDIDKCLTKGTIDSRCAAAGLKSITTNVPKIISTLRKAAGPDVEIAAMTYYDPFLAAYLTGSTGQVFATDSVELVKEVNNDLVDAFRAQNVRVVNVAVRFDTYLPVADTTKYAGRTDPIAVAKICRWTWMCAAPPTGPNIHANAAGYREIASVFEKSIAA